MNKLQFKRLAFRGILIYFTVLLFNSCGILMNYEIKCREFGFTNEKFWFPHKIGDTLSFYNQNGKRKLFHVVDKRIYHRDKYISDTGCGCLDFSTMLLTNYVDSIWFCNDLRYVYKNKPKIRYSIGLIIGNTKSIFNNMHLDTITTKTINGCKFEDIEKFSSSYKLPKGIKTLYRAKNIGIIQFMTNDGDVWTLSNFKTPRVMDIKHFRYETTYCGYDGLLGGFFSKKPPETIVRPAE